MYKEVKLFKKTGRTAVRGYYQKALHSDSDGFGTEEELPFYRTVYATKRPYVLMRVAKTLLDAWSDVR